MRVLIVESDKALRLAYRIKLGKAGFEVDEASDGDAALARLKAARPDAVLLDLVLPGKDGLDVLRDIRSDVDAAVRALPVFVVTNVILPAAARDARSAGATEVFIKSAVTLQEIASAIREALERKKTAA